MKKTIILIFSLLLALAVQAGTKITRTYSQLPLPEVLIDIDQAAAEIDIRFIYNKLEDYPVTCTISNASPLEAIQQAVGFYPVKVSQNGKTVIVEPIFDIDSKFTGRIVDEQGVPLEFANVVLLSLSDSSIIVGGVTNAGGDFVIPCKEERVLLRASFIGYQTVERECAVGSVGTIVLKEDAIKLSEVRKSATRPLAKMERGALVYDMPQLLSVLPADDAYEALTRIPGVNEVNGNIEFAGQQVTLIINGKATTLSAEQTKERLRQMPTDRLAKCEVMMSAPARYHVRGAVINIVTKDLCGQNHLSGQLRGAGIFSKLNSGFGAASLLWAKGKFSLDAGYNFKGGRKFAMAEHEVMHRLTTGIVPYHDMTENFNRSNYHSLYAQMEYAFAPNHRISLTYNGVLQHSRSHNITSGTKPSENNSHTDSRTHNADLGYSAPFGLKLGASYTHFEYPQEQLLCELIKSDLSAYISHSGQNIDKWDFTADQSHSLAHDWTLDYGAEMKITKHESWQETHMASGEPVSEGTSSLGYTERISSAYASLSHEFSKKLSAEVGAQVENCKAVTSTNVREQSGNYHTPQLNEWRIYPTMNILWKATPKNDLNLSFSSNSTYPDYWSLMSNVYYSSAYSEIWGNPYLKTMNSYVLSFMWRFRQRYTFTAVYQWDDDYIAQLPYQPSDRLAVVMQQINFDRSRQQLGFVANAQWKIGKWANGNVGGHYGFFRDRCDHFHDIPFDRLRWSGRLYATAAIKPFAKQNLTLIVQPLYQSKTIQGVYDIHAFFNLNASLRWTDNTGRLSVTLAGNNLTNFHFRTTDTWRGQDFSMRVNQNWRNVQLSLTYRLADYKAKQRKQVDTSRMGH